MLVLNYGEIETREQYLEATEAVEALITIVGNNEEHLLAPVLSYLTDLTVDYLTNMQ